MKSEGERESEGEATRDALLAKGNEAGGGGEEEGKAQMETLEDIMKVVGTRGRWNICLFVICGGNVATAAFLTLAYQFLGATPDHWCLVPPLRQANWTTEQIRSLTSPPGAQWTGCYMYDYNYTAAAQLGYNTSMARPDLLALAPTTPATNTSTSVTSCPAREFNLTQYTSTIVTEWDLVCERRVLYSTTQAVNQLGFLIGSVVAGILMDVLGRRIVFLVSVVLTVALGLATAISSTPEVFITLRFFTSVTIMTSYYPAFLIVMETCSASSRSTFGALYVLPWSVGYMLLPAIAYFIRQWQWLQVALTLPYAIFICFFWFLPESPRWLLQHDQEERALELLLKVAKVNRRPVPPIPVLQKALKRVKSTMMTKTKEDSEVAKGKMSLSRIKRRVGEKVDELTRGRRLGRYLAVMCMCWFTVSLVYYGLSLNATNLSADPYLYMFLGGLIEVPAYLALWLCLQHRGRRPTTLALFLLCGVCIAVSAAIMLTVPNVHVGVKITLSLAGKMGVAAAFHLLYLYTVELFPTRLRSLALGLCGFVGRLGSISSPYVNDILGGAKVWAPSVLFSSAALLAGLITLVLPETKDQNLPEKDHLHNDENHLNHLTAHDPTSVPPHHIKIGSEQDKEKGQ